MTISNPQKVFILRVGIDKINCTKALKKIHEMVLSHACHQVTTINPEFIVAAQKDKKFKSIPSLINPKIPKTLRWDIFC